MVIEDILSKISKREIIEFLTEEETFLKSIRDNNLELVTKEILEYAKLHHQKRNKKDVVNLILVGIFIGKETFIEKAKKETILRHSLYLESRNPIFSISEVILAKRTVFELSEKSVSYFKSLNNMLILYEEMRLISKDLNQMLFALKKRETVLKGYGVKLATIRTLLNFNELIFLVNRNSKNRTNDLTKLDHYTKEEISEAISMIVSKWEELIGLKKEDFTCPDYSLFKSPLLTNVIVLACLLKYFKEIEILIEKFSYKCILIGNRIEVSEGDDEFEKANEISLIVLAGQDSVNRQKLEDNFQGLTTYAEISEYLHNGFKELQSYIETPTKRYTFKIPLPLFEGICKTKQLTFKEEIFVAQGIEHELLIPFEEAANFNIRENISLGQFITLHKYFLLLNEIAGKRLISKLETEEEAVFNSLCAILSEDAVNDMLGSIENENVVKEFLDIVTWEAGVDKFLDLQYQPLIFVDGFYCVCYGVMSGSRMFRNIFPSESKKNNLLMAKKNDSYDKLVSAITNVLIQAGFEVKLELTIKHKTVDKNESDIDVLAIKDDIIIIIECKDTIAPVGIHELRTTFDQVVKASSQLRYCMEALSNEKFKNDFFTKHKLNKEKAYSILPLILIPNARFWGFNIEGIPIRNLHEFNTFLSNGEWNFQVPKLARATFSLWKSNFLTQEDIKSFLSTKSNAHKCLYDAAIPHKHIYKERIIINKFALDMRKVFANAKTSLRTLNIETLSQDEGE